MKLKLHLTVLCTVAAYVVCVGFSHIVHAQLAQDPLENHPEVVHLKEQIQEKEDQLENLKESTKAYEERIEEAKNASVTLESQIQLIDTQTTKLELDIKSTQLIIDKTRLELESLQFQINKEEEEINTQKDRLREYIKLIHKEEQKSLLEILLVNESFSEFFNQLNYIEEIQSDLKNSIDRVQNLREALETQKTTLVVYQTELEDAKKELERNQSRLKEQAVAKETLLVQTKSSEIRYQQLLREAQTVQNDIDSSINKIDEEIKRKIARLRTGGTDPKTTLLNWPLRELRGITAYFQDPTYPYRHLFEHSAIDLRAAHGTALLATADGYIARAADNGYGYSYVTIVHDNSLSTVYGHVSAIYVQTGQFVEAGQVIALSGGTPGTLGAGPFVTGPHLHFEVRLNGIPVDPLQYLP
jgi:murein DD-endopeptidase MepM/ murein hydrolase activator NlpD